MGRIAGLFLALLILAAIFGALERFFPAIRGQKRWRRGVKTDILYFFWDAFVNRAVAFVAILAVVLVIALAAGVKLDGPSIRAFAERDTRISAQPGWLQAAELLVLLDVMGYWSHRAFHEVAQLWKIHAIHHSSTQLDWLSAARVHPLNEALTRAAQVVPFLLLGYRPTLLAAYVPLLTFYAIFIHANVPWSFGRLRYVVASPVFHRWHHTSEAEGLNRNYAGLFPWLDALFGTFYLPRGVQPQRFGVIGDDIPDNILRHLVYPFRRGSAGRDTAPATA